MRKKVTKFQELRILLALIKNANEKGEVDFTSSEVDSDLSGIVANGNWLDSALYELNDVGIIYYEEIGEEGFRPFISAGVNAKTHRRVAELVSSIQGDYESMEQRITEILTFNPEQLSKTISDTQRKLDEVGGQISNNELLKPLERPLSEIRNHFNSVSTVSQHYEDVYKNIIRPVQEEGQSGVRATVKWAIISIAVSTGLSFLVSNWDAISALF
ncbi:hypothetical protein MHM84_20195 [Halomonas sp. McH1-25]|uniref:hypothetical protein n=1 Tax=unclassified Halomonas TaxID=2609666 RepID=UPI001EF624C8|nr:MULTISPECIES: hypothetical protein [unclassified Halomonas]MCG7602067.1 hypothetical protein [Halomonas sp. McH1-25]MCP1342903.1 hypothetical protein [Halomonas sp. FL8]MCP1362522.1 hypothetical protein [Halomonas sp. BBD45]MCP1363645.1 hypothetical protein [Halomonas sp. BBD48]